MGKKPVMVIIAAVYYLICTIVTFIVVVMAMFAMKNPISMLFLLLLIPYATGFILLLQNSPAKWHHTYCAAVGNISGFTGIIGAVLDFFTDGFGPGSLLKLSVSVLVIILFLTFDFDKGVRNYFGKS